ncbi:hypothetical protein JCM15548_11155 [Geofilum rubicundum JCM 15548]|uniref:DUF5723 domain-containing protein n=2 Tax=Geofilum TaxID=1236988 RepID=A0A0E9LTV6_9BACT|nr:hypothetical protein JCM15548_11155 [Geofilum rubicundum JCM 15548]
MKPPAIRIFGISSYERPILFCFCLSLIFMAPSNAQHSSFKSPLGGILGSSGALEKSPWAIFSNPAGLSVLKKPVGGIGYQNDFYLKELSTRTAFASVPFHGSIFSGAFTHSGYQHFRKQQYHLALSKNLAPWLNMGLRFNYHLRYLTGRKNQRLLTLDAGWQLAASEKIHLGFHALNPARSQWHIEGQKENHLVVLATSVDYRPVSDVRLEAGLAKKLAFPPTLSMMVESQVHEAVTIKGTAVSAPLRFGLGTGIIWQSLGFEMGLMHHETLGFSSAFGLLYHLNHTTKKP